MDTTGSDGSVGNEGLDLPKFVAFRSLSNEKFLRPGGVHRYMKFEAMDAIRWGVKHEVQNAKCGRGLVHIRCCDTGKYWAWGPTMDSKNFITALADQTEEEENTRGCTLIKPSHTTKGDHKVVNLQVMYEGKWWSVGVNDGGYLVDSGEEDFLISSWESLNANQPQRPCVDAENMDTIGSDASFENEGLDLPKFVAFNSLLNKKYLRPEGEDSYIKFMAVEAMSWGVKHEIVKAKSEDEDGLVHIRCCDTGNYWTWGQTPYKKKWMVAAVDHPVEDTTSRDCTLIKPSQYTKDGIIVINFQARYEGIWRSIGGDSTGYLQYGGEDFILSNFESLQPVVNDEMVLPKFVVFNSLSNKKYLRPGGVHGYMKFEAMDAVRWGVKHEVENAKYGHGLVHIRCCDTGKYWTWGLTMDSKNFITAQADQTREDETRSGCTLIKPSHTTKGDHKVVNLQVMYEGKWWSIGVNDGGYLVDSGEEDFLILDWELQQANQPQGPFVSTEKMDIDASVENERLDLQKFVTIKSILNKSYLHPEGDDAYIRYGAVDATSWGVKHEIRKAKSEGGLVHIRCCDTGNYWTWGQTDDKKKFMVAVAAHPVEDTASKSCTLIKPSVYIKDGVRVVNFQARYEGIWRSIGGDSTGYLQYGGEDFIISNFESLQPAANEEMSPKFVVFNSLSNRNYLRPGGVHRYMKFEAVDPLRWGVKHEVQNAKYKHGLVNIRCCDTGKYWSFGQTMDTKNFIIAQADRPMEDETRGGCTLIKLSNTTKGDHEVVNLQVMYYGKWWSIGVNDGGHLIDGGEKDFVMSKWESLQANQPQGSLVSAENMDTADSTPSIENEGLDLPKFVAFNSLLSNKYLSIHEGSGNYFYVRFEAENVKSLGVKYEVQKAKCGGELVHIKCCDTGKYWSWRDSRTYIVAMATQPEEDKNKTTCTLIKPSRYTKDDVIVVNLQIMSQGTWCSIGVDGDGYLKTGGEDFIVSNWETLQMGLKHGPLGACVRDSVTLKLCPTNYRTWKKQMLSFLQTQELNGFVDGTIKPPNKPPSLRDSRRILEEEICEDEEQEHRVKWKQEREVTNRPYTDWKAKDGLVKGWILATLTEDKLREVTNFVTAREVWMELWKIFASSFQLSYLELIDLEDRKRGQMVSQYIELHKAALTDKWETAEKFFETYPDAVSQPITSSLETALIVAIRSPKRNKFVKKLIDKMVVSQLTEKEMDCMVVQEKVTRLALTDMSGATALHAAAEGGNIVAARLLVQKNEKLANMRDKHGTLAVHLAAGLGNRKMVQFLLKTTNLSENESGLKLLHFLASSGLYDVAFKFLEEHTILASMEPSPLAVIAQKHTSFHSGTNWNIVQRLIYSGIPSKLEDITSNPQDGDTGVDPQGKDIENPFKSAISALSYVRKKGNALFWDVTEKLESVLLFPFNCRPIKSIRKAKIIHYQALNLVKRLCEEVVKIEPANAVEIFIEPLMNATCMGIHEIVEEILLSYPSAVHLRNENNQSLFHLAVMYRHEKVFNLIHQMEEDWRPLLSIPDVSQNNALHLAGNLGTQQQLVLQASTAGAALQMQRELQWFKAVEEFILPQAKERKNKEEKTPQELFTETHKDLVKEGETWMKDTANSCSIVAALVTTIVFAAAITVPGGSDSNSGLPIRLGYQAFTLFLISDALAMFSSTTSLLMFLSILTSRYGEQDFLYSLPRRMIIGLATLFLSILSMMVAFGATLKIVSGKTRVWIIICVAILSCVPVTLFALLQFPLLLDMIKSTYYPSIKKQSNHILHEREENN